MNEGSLPVITVFSRPGCHLCEELVEALLPMVRGRLAVDVQDVDQQPEWQSRYGLRIPVVCYDGEELSEFTLDRAAIERVLATQPGS